MKIFAASLVGIAMIASPVLAQQDNTATPDQQTTANVKTTTKHVHATNVPKNATHHSTSHHHATHCGCPPTHKAAHHAKAHHVEKKTTTTSTTSTPQQ